MTGIYRITTLGPPVGDGADSPIVADLGGVAKTNDRARFTIANEVICGHLGRVLGLPVPPGLVARDVTGRSHFVSLDVSAEGKVLPPIIPAEFTELEPWLASGCVVFDILVANPDRHIQNLSRDEAFSPPRVSLFDHGAALLGSGILDGPPRLAALEGRLGCDGASGVRNVLMDEIASDADLANWVQRVESVPEWVYEDACKRLLPNPELSLSTDVADALIRWLTQRAAGIRKLIRSNEASFPKIGSWGLLW